MPFRNRVPTLRAPQWSDEPLPSMEGSVLNRTSPFWEGIRRSLEGIQPVAGLRGLSQALDWGPVRAGMELLSRPANAVAGIWEGLTPGQSPAQNVAAALKGKQFHYSSNPYVDLGVKAIADPLLGAGKIIDVAKLPAAAWSTQRALMRARPDLAPIFAKMPGIGRSIRNMAQRGVQGLLDRIPQAGQLSPVAARASAMADVPPKFSDYLYAAMGKHAVIVPKIPRGPYEPLVLKTPARNISPILEALGEPVGNLNRIGTYSPRRVSGELVDRILVSTPWQKTVIPHETTHWSEDLLTADFTKKMRPEIQRALERQRAGMTRDEVRDMLFRAWTGTPVPVRDVFQKTWGRMTPRRWADELVAELTHPDALPERLRNIMTRSETNALRNQLLRDVPDLDKFIRYVQSNIQGQWYWMPSKTRPTPLGAVGAAVNPSPGRR